MAVLMK
jgi:hypothetical protein